MTEFLDQPWGLLAGLTALVLIGILCLFIARLRTDLEKLESHSNSQLKRLGARFSQLSEDHDQLVREVQRLPRSASLSDQTNDAVLSLSRELAAKETRIFKSILNESDLAKGLEQAFHLLQPDPDSSLWIAYSVSVLDQHQGRLELTWQCGLNGQMSEQMAGVRLEHGSSPQATAAMLGEDVVVESRQLSRPGSGVHGTPLPAGVQIWHSYPIKKLDGGVLGTFDILRFHEGIPVPASDRIANYLFVISIILERHSYLSGLLSQARTDRLTGINNRGYAEESLVKEVDRSRRYSNPLSVIIFDIDHFKSFNDTYGHDVGDLVLQEVARLAAGAIRATDIIGRWGGEEFLIILSETTIENALVVAENVRKAVESARFDFSRSVTISVGVSRYVERDTAQTLVKRADEALYRAKESGRNRVLAQPAAS